MKPNSSLASQLSQLRLSTPALKLQPNQLPASLLFSQSVAKTVDIDMVHSLAMLGYGKLRDQLDSEVHAQLLSHEMKGLNRNHLSRKDNDELSTKLRRALLELSPYFLAEDCQKVLEYLLRNFSVHVFDAESLCLMYLQYWKEPIYHKLIKNVSLENRHLTFLKPLLKKEQQVNSQMIVRAIGHDNYVLEKLRTYCLQLLQKRQSNTQIVMLVEENPTHKTNPLCFLYSIYMGLLSRAFTKYVPTVTQFCLELLKHPNQEAVNCMMALFVQMMIGGDLAQNILLVAVKTVVRKMTKSSFGSATLNNICEFVLVVWQRYSQLFEGELVEMLVGGLVDEKLVHSVGRISVASIYLSLFKAYISGVHSTKELLKKLSLQIKVDRLLVNNPNLEQKFYKELFSQFDHFVDSVKPKQKNSGIEFLEELLLEDFEFEFAQYINETMQKRMVKDVQRLFKKRSVTKNRVDMKGIVKKMPVEIEQVKETKSHVREEKMEEEEDHEEPEVTHSKPLLEILKQLNPNTDQINYNNSELIPHLNQLVSDYYLNEKPQITAQQKNTILENIGLESYTKQNLKKDLKLRDWAIPIQYVQNCPQSELLSDCADLATTQPDLLDDLLYRQLMRCCINQLCELSKVDYGRILQKLNKLTESLVKVIDEGYKNIITIIDICSYAVKRLSEANLGLQKGKLFRLILVHVRLLTRVLNSGLYTDKVSSIFKSILDLYGPNNLYIFYVGFAQQISKSAMKADTIQKLKKILIELFLQRQPIDLLVFVTSCVKVVGLVSVLVKDVEGTPADIKKTTRYNQVPKGILIKLFGVIRPKQKNKLVRNTLFIMRYLFLSREFMDKFDKSLGEMSEQQRDSLVEMFSELYETALNIKSTNIKVSATVNKLLQDITNLFPMSIFVKLLIPLLPNNQLYSLLLRKLEQHPKFKLRDLQTVLNIVPDKLSVQYCDLARACLQRDCKAGEEWVQWLLSTEDQRAAIGLLAELSKKQSYILVPHLESATNSLIQVLKVQDQYGLAVCHIFISQLAGLLDPYLETILSLVLPIQSELVKQFIVNFVSTIETNSLIVLARHFFKQIQSNLNDYQFIINFCYYLIELCKKGTGQDLVKGFYGFLQATSKQIVEDDGDNIEVLERIQKLQAQAFQHIVLKLNEIQLKKVINNLASWSNKDNVQSLLPFNCKKPVLVKISTLLTEVMGDLFVPFYGYFFEQIIEDLNTIHSKAAFKDKKPLKRAAELSKKESILTADYLGSILRSLQLLFDNDPQEQFVDSVRFDILKDPLSQVFELTRLFENSEEYFDFIEKYLAPCLISLCKCVKDDYKLKTLNYNILLRLRLENDQIRLTIFKFIDGLVEEIGDRYLVIVNDLVPFVAEYIYSINQPLQKAVKMVVNRLEALSGQDLKEYIQAHATV